LARDDRTADEVPGRLSRLRASLPTLPFPRRSPGTAPRATFSREDARRLNERFALLGRAERRAIVRAVNRGEGMPKRRDAELAIGVARRQQRFWTRAWLLGPAIAVVQVLVTPIGWQEGLLLAAWGSLLLGMMAAWWWTRARRAELINLATIGPRGLGSGSRDRGRDTGQSVRGGTGRRSRLPGGRSTPSSSTEPDLRGDDGTDQDDGRGDGGPTAVRPPRPRGRKRR
jgi:hypothetical protein